MDFLQKVKKFLNPKGFKQIDDKELKILLTNNKISKAEMVSHNEIDIIFEDNSIVRISGSEYLQFSLSKVSDRR